jgi:hypothetical protein
MLRPISARCTVLSMSGCVLSASHLRKLSSRAKRGICFSNRLSTLIAVPSSEALVKVAQVQAAPSNRQAALNTAEGAIELNPKATAAIELRKSISAPH